MTCSGVRRDKAALSATEKAPSGSVRSTRGRARNQRDVLDAALRSAYCQAAVNRKHRAVQVAGLVGGQEGDERCDFLRRTVAPGRDQRVELHPHRVGAPRREALLEGTHHARFNRPGLTELIRIPLPAHSAAALRVSPITACLLAL